MTNGELIQRVQSLYSKGVQSDDTRLSEMHIYNKLITTRNKLIYQKLNKRQKINQWSYQDLPCIELIKAPVHECACLPNIGCSVLRSKYKIPKIISNIDRHLIQSVSSLDGSVIFSESTFETQKYAKGNKFTSAVSDYYIRNGYLYITLDKSLEVITLTAIFENPEEAENFPSYCQDGFCPDCQCMSMQEKDFYIDSELIDTMIEITVQELVEVFSQMREDITNDTRDSLIQESKS